MSAAFVVDCSIAGAWLFHDEATPRTADLLNRLTNETAIVPAWWFIEITNVLAMVLTSYDAMYLDLAVRLNLPLATLDDDLRKTAKKLGVSLLG